MQTNTFKTIVITREQIPPYLMYLKYMVKLKHLQKKVVQSSQIRLLPPLRQ